MSVNGGNGLADYCFEEEDYSLVDQVEEEKPQQQQEDYLDFHIVPSAFGDSSDRNIHQHDVSLSSSSRKSKREKKPISFEVRMMCTMIPDHHH
jgi:hypothetical protein